jgi:tRNA threonylcarbamoyl adenosine modification protein YeaZ
VLLLAFDTATPAVTVALCDGDRVLAQAVTVDARRHGELLAPSIAKVIADAGAERGNVTGIAVGVGPGPYTGLRVGVVTARVLGAALEVPVHGVCTLDVIAADAASVSDGEFLVATDARRKEVYWARYSSCGQRLSGPDVARPDQLDADLSNASGLGIAVAGQGPQLYPDVLRVAIGPEYPSAGTLAQLVARQLRGAASGGPGAGGPGAGGPGTSGPGTSGTRASGVELLPPEPLYLRRPDARIPGPPKRVTPS